MADSSYVYESGSSVTIGSHGTDNYAYVSGSPLRNSGGSTFVFQSGTGIGGGGVIIRGRGGESQTEFGTVANGESVSSFYDYQSNSRANGAVLNYTEQSTMTVMVYEEPDGDRYLLVVYGDKGVTDGGKVGVDLDGLSDSGMSYAVKDDPEGGQSADVYNYSGPTGDTYNEWANDRTDGWALGPYSSGTYSTNIDVTQNDTNDGYQLSDVKFVGSNGNIKRSISTSTTIQINFSVS